MIEVNEVNHDVNKHVKASRLWIILVLGTLTSIGPLAIDLYLPSLPKITDDLQTSASLTQLTLTAFLLGLALGQLFVGSISDIYGRRKPLIIALIILVVSSLLCAVAPSIWILILLRFLQGASGSAGIVISRAMVRDMYSGSEMTKFFSLLMLVNGAAPILSPVIGGQLLKVTSWHGVFVVLGAICVFMLVSVVFVLPETLPPEERATGGLTETLSTYKKLLKDRLFMGYALSQGLVLGAMFAYISGSPFVLQNIYGASPQEFSLFFALNGIGVIIATHITGRLAGKVSEKTLFVAGIVIAVVGGISLLLTIVLGIGLIGVLCSLFLIGSSVGVVTTPGFSLAMRNQKQAAGTASALLGLFQYILGALVAPLVGIGGSNTAIPMGIVIALCEAGAVLCFIFMANRSEKQFALREKQDISA
ncbi:Bcr/CflA family drug resistance efflux transporter [Bacillus mycoides]|uniref:Bcr/CflA family multidrug efflux MFS transporter n=1 Tax=Bacillus TaxID=1386 RepID=UPI0007AB4405|nr:MULTISPECIES: Bcr/CflA family multidrug efflux MFS transporter [Bacillus cereus group]OAK37761.1 Bcr/CflA family drug resistance efflux transporter [Bacillus wiedmannii]OAK41157.1 Bcr/CflA family drug resistance efflux transporter [Bacillus wiedmannii]OFD51493.1 Bcr/CflA family drug resistance efflux transporter [Bacillus mycoides]OFD53370.1 Bcr/CflA family drug resistance efflux transporter [Bacillus mycoides]PHB66627.1 Bcr/CflA family drug resistance efflux transporter [Bacillus wiedmanni